MTARLSTAALATALSFTAFLVSTGPPAIAAAEASVEPVPAEWLTVAEASGYTATGSYEETMELLGRIAGRLPEVDFGSFGTSAAGRPLPLIVVDPDRRFTPEAAAAAGRPVVMIQAGIHAGEIDGKDALLMLLRDAALGRRPELVAGVVLVIAPIYNVDGHERVSPFNRPNQNGPVEGMGWRTTESGLDLNRDHLKLVSPEARALVALAGRWRPHLHVDLHVTDGVDHDWVLTWAWAEAPQIDPAVDAWLAARMPRVLAATAAAGHRNGPYVDLLDRDDPAAGFTSRVPEPRYATGFWPLVHRPSILVETHAPRPYRDRVLATRDFLAALVAEVAREPGELPAAVAEAERRTVALGEPGAAPSPAVLTWEPAPPERIRLPMHAWEHRESIVAGGTVLTYDPSAVREIEVDWVRRSVPGVAVARPRGYLVPPGWPAIEERLAGHGLRTERLARPVEVEVETIRVSEPEWAVPPYQGLTRVAARVERPVETVELPAGTLWIPADQPGFEVAVQLFEPEAPDSLFAWGLLSSVLEQKEYVEPRVLEAWVRERLAAEPDLAEAWRRALDDPAVAADPAARRRWWYARSPWWDERLGRLPIYRVMPAGLTAVDAALTTARSAG